MNDGWRKFDPNDKATWPGEETTVLGYWEDDKFDPSPFDDNQGTAYIDGLDVWRDAKDRSELVYPTHWRPLPSPPEGE